MTERLSDIEARIGSVHQLSSVIGAMRGIAAARTLEASKHLDGVRAYASTTALAIGSALALVPDIQDQPSGGQTGGGGQVIVALCAEQGFAGSFSHRILEHVSGMMKAETGGATELLLIGDRGLLAAVEFEIVPDWSAPMIASTAQAAGLSNRIMDELYERIGRGGVQRVFLVHASPGAAVVANIVERQLVPFDFSRFASPAGNEPPLLNLAPQRLLASLVEEYVFAELCEAVVLSYAAENEARMRAMVSAQRNVAETLETLTASARRQRQEEITNEICELSAGILSRNAS
ncbi:MULTISPECIES: F0F1 ATP synthase subunit gamma [Alphaproteobacteria]|uniref:F-type H+-transporting ATPase subunit gamma n=2 Tax=Alphaproteobacteria TaxID=28211 RepID=A0A512HL12_9HYPH|nr:MULTISPECIES: FoF1 ATP synthase subunit gamma [Alphaproteobacteria]GEO86133.1 hypothetical protein RNA01_30650 [Ciceribacter naphthalenivorans]GLR22700.1 hypothetical protein GCM10007920_24880 [Ciceribacter naphthalenivorans]GLT05556.1 hypothetical protein GCM10007926_24880 [Sphingomonas psychrolutea]